MKLTIHYEADADKIGAIIEDLPDSELRRLVDMVDLLPELFPKLTALMVEHEWRGRGLDR